MLFHVSNSMLSLLPVSLLCLFSLLWFCDTTTYRQFNVDKTLNGFSEVNADEDFLDLIGDFRVKRATPFEKGPGHGHDYSQHPRFVQFAENKFLTGMNYVFGHKSELNLFLGVPYAEPPTKAKGLRFKPPIDFTEWTGYYDATSYKPLCPQDLQKLKHLAPKLEAMNEDCLYLDIYAPNITAETTEVRQYPVMVFLHGGEFMWGTSRLYAGLVLARKEIIVVSVNYRLGPFGFLTTEDDQSRGNYGIMDMFKALKFIRENIEVFGGNTSSITVVGHEAGAAGLGILLVSPKSRDEVPKLFHRAVLMGGSDTSEWAVIPPNQRNGMFYAYQLARHAGGCTAPEWNGESAWDPEWRRQHEEIVRCLRETKTWREVSEAAAKMSIRWGTTAGPFAPSVDGPNGWLPEMPRQLRQKGLYTSMPMIAGVCRDAGSYHVQRLNVPNIEEGLSDKQISDLFESEFVTPRKVLNHRLVRNALRFVYTFWPNPYNATARTQMLIDAYSDTLYGMGPDEIIKNNTRMENTSYFYVFGYRSLNEPLPFWMGAPHGKDIEYVLGYPYFNNTMRLQTGINPLQKYSQYNKIDENMTDFMMHLWSRFAKYGNTTIQISENYPLRNFTWAAYDTINLTYGNLDEWSKNFTKYRQIQYDFWRSYWAKIEDQWPITTTVPPTPASYVAYQSATYSFVALLVILLLVLVFICYASVRKDRKYKYEQSGNFS